MDASRTDQVEGPAIAEIGVEAEEPVARGLPVVDAQQLRHDELEQVDAERVRLVDASAAPPARDLRDVDAEHVRHLAQRGEVLPESTHLVLRRDSHAAILAQQILLRYTGAYGATVMYL